MRNARTILIMITAAVFAAQIVSPVTAHVGDDVGHLWAQHIGPLVKKEFYTQNQTDNRYVKKAAVSTGFFSCPGSTWQEHESTDAYGLESHKRYATTDVTSFYCNAVLPHGAKVRSARFSVHDSHSTGFISCGLLRVDLATQVESFMAFAQTGFAATPGDAQVSDGTITTPRIDNKNFIYPLRCVLYATNADIGFYGASIRYTITGARAAAS